MPLALITLRDTSEGVERCQPLRVRVVPETRQLHELRHMAASLAVSVGANVKALQRLLGHKCAAMTLDR